MVLSLIVNVYAGEGIRNEVKAKLNVSYTVTDLLVIKSGKI